MSDHFGTLCIKGLKKLYEICTDDYDNNGYLVVKTLDFLPTISYDICNVMFVNEQKR